MRSEEEIRKRINFYWRLFIEMCWIPNPEYYFSKHPKVQALKWVLEED